MRAMTKNISRRWVCKRNKYDEYADEYEYYIGFSKLKTFTKVEIKETVIKKVLMGDEEKSKNFFELQKTTK